MCAHFVWPWSHCWSLISTTPNNHLFSFVRLWPFWRGCDAIYSVDSKCHCIIKINTPMIVYKIVQGFLKKTTAEIFPLEVWKTNTIHHLSYAFLSNEAFCLSTDKHLCNTKSDTEIDFVVFKAPLPIPTAPNVYGKWKTESFFVVLRKGVRRWKVIRSIISAQGCTHTKLTH